jgi:hypothetical protein
MHHTAKDIHKLKAKDWKKILPGMWKLKTSRSSYSHIRQSRYYTKIRRDKEGHYILIKGTIQQEDITVINLYAPNIRAPIFLKQSLLKKEQIGPGTIIVGDLNTPLSSIEDVLELNNSFEKMDIADIYKVFHPRTVGYTFFSASHGTFSKIDHILGHKANLNKYKKN